MNPQYAILLDGGFVTKKLEQKIGQFPSAEAIIELCQSIGGNEALVGHDLLRYYWYDAPPATDRLTNPIDQSELNLRNTRVYSDHKRLSDRLILKPHVACRLGVTDVRGWRVKPAYLRELAEQSNQSDGSSPTPRALSPTDLEPNIEQKGVDLRIGLDIARLSLKQIVRVIVVVSGDSDLVPAFKFARREGLLVYLHHMGHSVRQELKQHADLIMVHPTKAYFFRWTE